MIPSPTNVSGETTIGGLWAVLMTDMLQFIVLQLAVLFVVPLLLMLLGTDIPRATLPDGFFSPTSDRYGILFPVGWAAVHFFFVGAEWAFAQRYISVPTKRDAKKSAYLFGALYLVSPTVWLITPILYRMIDGEANPEQAYILASKLVLPVGMLGLMMAAMFSATASAVSAQINVFAGVLSEQFYRRLVRPKASESQMLRMGRIFTFAIGTILILVALLVPYAGGAEKIVLTITAMLLGPLMAPTVWGLLTSRVGFRALLAASLTSFAVGLIVKFILNTDGLLGSSLLGLWTQGNPRIADIIVGAVVPNIILAAAHYSSTRVHPGWIETERRISAYEPATGGSDSHGSSEVVTISLAGTGLLMLALLLFDDRGRVPLAIFGMLMITLAVAIRLFSRRKSQVAPPGA